jgi:hypothetical protein
MPGIKGTAIESVIADVKRLVEAGRIARVALEVRLEPGSLALLDEKIMPALWYSIAAWGELTRLLLEVEGGGDPAYLVERGRRAAGRLHATGIYAQLDGERERWGDRLGNVMATIGPALYRDTSWRFETLTKGDPRHFRVSATVPPEFPDVGLHPTLGFIDYMANVHSKLGVRLAARRVSATELEFVAAPDSTH